MAKNNVKPRPSPNRILRTGADIVPVIAISANPFLVIAISAVQSPRELPQAMTVSPNKAFGRVVTKPHSYRRSIMVSAVNLIHMMLIMNAKIANIILSHPGGFDTFVHIRTPPARNIPGIIQ